LTKLLNMKLLLFCGLLFISLTAYNQPAASITVTIKDIKDNRGSILVGIYTSKDDFLKNPSIRKIVKVTGSEVTVVFDNLPKGEYAVSIIHDENDNKEFDRNKLGIPKEGYCFGNNALGKLGPPTYDQVKIMLSGESIRQTLEMKYL
jgi:uncharacterized protein (DUF2141 family)